MNKKTEILKKIKDYVAEIDPTAEVILFGSRARGDERSDSDWDIIILTSEDADIKAEQIFRHKLFEIELEYGQPISTFVYSKTDWHSIHKITPLFKNVAREGIAL
jgi:uncharacterized protein